METVLTRTHARLHSPSAFTLIELLIVVLIIAILIAIAAPSFLGQTAKAQDSIAKQYLTVAWKAIHAESTGKEPPLNDTDQGNAITSNEPGDSTSTAPDCVAAAAAYITPKHICVTSGTTSDSPNLCNHSDSGKVWCLTTPTPNTPVITDETPPNASAGGDQVPTVSIDSHPPSRTSLTSGVFTFSSDIGTSFRCDLDGSGYGSCASPKSYSSLANGTHTFSVKALTDTETSAPADYTWAVDATAPVVMITAAPDNPSAASASFSFAASDPDDDSSTLTYQCRLDAGAYSVCTNPQSYSSLAIGSHTFYVKAADALNNVGEPVSYTWTVVTVVSLAGGAEHTCAVLSSGAARCWGYNGYGQLGNGTLTDRLTPISVSGLSNATAISTGGYHTCALLSGGTIKCWGSNGGGELGDGTTTQRLMSVSVSGISNATAISGGDGQTCALLSGGTVKCWGSNFYGELGDGTTTNRSTPVSVSGLSNATAISAGGQETCALISGGTVKCWGRNTSGGIGDGTTTNRPTPVSVSGISNATAISVGAGQACALLSDGTAKCWGKNSYGNVGDGTTTNRSTPVSVSGLSNATAITAGRHTCALLSDGTAKCWGSNFLGGVGDGTTTNRLTPVSVSGLSNATAISAGWEHTCALLSDGTAKCWGYNSSGRLGDGTTTNRVTPVSVLNLP